MTRGEAERVAIEALGWLAADMDLMGAFLAVAGASPDELRAQAQDPVFLGFVLEHILSADSLVTGFCDACGHPYDLPMRARAALPGGDMPNWT